MVRREAPTERRATPCTTSVTPITAVQPDAPLLSQVLPCLAHGQSLGGHPSPFRGAGGPADGPASLRFGQRPDHDPPIPVITMPIFLITIDRSR